MREESIKFSLVLATLGRSAEVRRFLDHLDGQTFRSFELILIDQNADGYLDSILSAYEERFCIRHLRSRKGLSRGRNVGLEHISGNVVCFPDDDCWYPANTLERVADALSANQNCDGITGRAVDESGSSHYDWFPERDAPIDRKNVWRQAISFTIFLRRDVIHKIGYFDETLGVGSDRGRLSGEETDYLIRTIDAGFNLAYHADICVFHPCPIPVYSRKTMRKTRAYAKGFSYVLKKHHYPFAFVSYYWARALGGVLISLAKLQLGNTRYHFAVLTGRILGWLE